MKTKKLLFNNAVYTKRKIRRTSERRLYKCTVYDRLDLFADICLLYTSDAADE